MRATAAWNWRLSGHCRAASLASAWVIVMLSGLLGPLLMPLAAIRFVASAIQSWLNIRLGRRNPVCKQTRGDYVLIGLIFAGAYLSVGLGHFTGNMTSPVLYVPMLVPFSVLQVRMTVRSYRAYAAETGEGRVVPFPAPATSGANAQREAGPAKAA